MTIEDPGLEPKDFKDWTTAEQERYYSAVVSFLAHLEYLNMHPSSGGTPGKDTLRPAAMALMTLAGATLQTAPADLKFLLREQLEAAVGQELQ